MVFASRQLGHFFYIYSGLVVSFLSGVICLSSNGVINRFINDMNTYRGSIDVDTVGCSVTDFAFAKVGVSIAAPTPNLTFVI